MSNPYIYNIAVPAPLASTFEYSSDRLLEHGLRVEVAFAGRQVIGMIISRSESPQTPREKLKAITAVLDTDPVFSPALFDLLIWAANYYLHPIGEVFAAALPTKVRQGGALVAETKRLKLNFSDPDNPVPSNERQAPKQAALIDHLRKSGGLDRSQLVELGFSSAVVRALIQKKRADWHTERLQPVLTTSPTFTETVALTQEQSMAIDSVKLSGNNTYLLYGITGSGKTEVYLQLIHRVLQAGRQALILVPEIALTPQTLSRFQTRFDCSVVALHSGLTDVERSRHWQAARSGRASIVIGTRSAIFTPLPQLGIIIVDEEHDASYKQQDGFHYSARDLATVRAANESIPVVLGSATPSLESIQNATAGKYHLLQLRQRANGAQRESYRILPVPANQTEPFPDPALFAEIQATLDRGEQVLIMRNRRGYAPILFCTHCRWIAECSACDARLTVHRHQKGLRCHHCGAQHPLPRVCPSCQQVSLTPVGDGTQRLEASFQAAFKGYPIVRVDSDNTRGRSNLDQALSSLRSDAPCILIGTQLIAKGHHFPYVTLAIVLDVDQGFLSADFKAIERTSQLIVQTGGRSGRAHLPGKVYLSSRTPNLPGLNALIESDYLSYAGGLLTERAHYDLPPFSHQALIRADARQPLVAHKLLEQAQRSVKGSTGAAELLGPVSPNMERRAGWHRAQLLVSANTRQARFKALKALQQVLGQKAPRSIRWSIDVDPADFF